MAPNRDPVCGMIVDPAASKPRAEHGGVTYYFCCAGCREKFLADPAKYLKPAQPSPPPPSPSRALYTCPMHPQIKQAGPGACPLCGMALEPLEAAADSGPNAELTDMTRRLWIAALLALPVLVLEMGVPFPGLEPSPHRFAAGFDVDSVRVRFAGRTVGRVAVLRARLAFGPQPLAQHVQPDRARHRRGISLQPRRHILARPLSGGLADGRRRPASLLRIRVGHHRAGAVRAGARAPRPRTDRRRHPRLAQARAQDRAAHRRGRCRRGMWPSTG